MSDSKARHKTGATVTSENDALIQQLRELVSGLLRLCDSLAASNPLRTQEVEHGDHQAISGTKESPSEGGTLLLQQTHQREHLFPFIIANGIEIPYHSSPPYPLLPFDSTCQISEAVVEGSELARFRVNMSQVPQDGRIMLSPGSTRMEYLQWTMDFCAKLDEIGGAFWVRDFDIVGRVKHYHYDHDKCDIYRDHRAHHREEGVNVRWIDPHQESEAIFDVPPAVWPRSRFDHEELWRRVALPVPQAPWKRLILCQGLSMMMDLMDCSGVAGKGLKYSRNERENILDARALIPFVHDYAVDQVIKRYLGEFGMNRANWTEGQTLKTRNGFAFLISWFQIAHFEPRFVDWRTRRNGGLQAGPLYNDKYDRTLMQDSFAVFAIPGDDQLYAQNESRVLRSHHYWTILVLSPLGWYRRSIQEPAKVDSQDIGASTMQCAALDLIADALHRVSLEWDKVCRYTEEVLDSTASVFVTSIDDKLLFDDDGFSISRKYFWLINSVHEFGEMIAATIHTWEEYKAGYVEPYLDVATKIPLNEKNSLQTILLKVEHTIQNLKHIQGKLARQREKGVAVRDGLFSASSVRESKMSSRLAENIKLLTYVSIFYLPLTFCVSIWSTSDTLGYSAMIITTVIVAFVTYFVVLNLNHLAAACAKYYAYHKGILVQQMKQDENWKSHGRRFEQSQPGTGDQELKPSEWLVVIYWLTIICKSSRFKSLKPATNEETQELPI